MPCALHILDAIERIRHIQARGDLTQDQVLYSAALRNLQTSSEATQQLPDTLKAAQPDVSWREFSEFRHIVVHNYLGDIDPDTVAAFVDRHLEPLAHAISVMLREP